MVIDELIYAESILKNQQLDINHEGYDLSILCKYYIHEGYDYKKTRKLLEEFCIKNIKYFNIVTRYSLIDYAIRSSKSYKLSVPIEIIITQQEISSIQHVNDVYYQRFLFTLLVLAKQQKYNSNKIKFKESSRFIGFYYNGYAKEVIKHAGLTWSNTFENKMMHELKELEYINMTIPKGSIIVKYASVGYPALVIKDFRNIGLQYLKYLGDKKVGECENCGSIFMRRSKLQVLCNECQGEHRRELSRKLMEENRKMLAGLDVRIIHG